MYFVFFLMSMINAICFADNAYPPQKYECEKDIVEQRLDAQNARYKTFVYALNLFCTRGASMIVETGTARAGSKLCLSDGCSTLIFATLIKNCGGEFYSIDNNAAYLQNAADALGDLHPFVNLINSDSITFLKNFNRPIDFLYLDSFDFDPNNPNPSQIHHLKEIVAAYPWLTPKSFVMIDDCALPHGGKGKLVIAYLVAKGWKILVDEYQVILSRE